MKQNYKMRGTSLAIFFLINFLFLKVMLFAGNFNVGNAAGLRSAIDTIDNLATADVSNTITLDNDITLNSVGLLQMVYANNQEIVGSYGDPFPNYDLTIIGQGFTIDGNNEEEPGLFIRSGVVTINDVTFFECKRQGGNGGNHDEGGGGALGAGGALFIMGGINGDSPVDFKGNNLVFTRCIAAGGNGGNPLDATQAGDGGGGGFGGDGGAGGAITGVTSGGGGGGFGGKGGEGVFTNIAEPFAGGGGGGLLQEGADGGNVFPAGQGGLGGGGTSPLTGGNGGSGLNFGSGGAGAGNSAATDSFGGGDGQFGGGGGATNGDGTTPANLIGGDGGFGGGGGGGSSSGGFGGFGAGGAANIGNLLAQADNSGFCGGKGGADVPVGVGPGGGGAGMGGALFIHGGDSPGAGANVYLKDPVFINNQAVGGLGGIFTNNQGTRTGGAGRSFGNDIYLMSGGNLTFEITGGVTTQIFTPIAGNQGRGPNSNHTHNNITNPINTSLNDGRVLKTGPGKLVLYGMNTYSGTDTTVEEGALRLERGNAEYGCIMTPVIVSPILNEAVLEIPTRGRILFTLNSQDISLTDFISPGDLPSITLLQEAGSRVIIGDANAIVPPLVNETVLQIQDGYTQNAGSVLQTVLCSSRLTPVAFVEILQGGATMSGTLDVDTRGNNFIEGTIYTIVHSIPGQPIDITNLDNAIVVTGDLAGTVNFDVVDQLISGMDRLQIIVVSSALFIDVPTDDPNCRSYIDYIRSLPIVLNSSLAIFLENLGNPLLNDELCNIILRNVPSVYNGLEWVNLDSQRNMINAINFLPECLYSPRCYKQGGQFWFRSTGWFEDYNKLQSMVGFKTNNASFTLGYDHFISNGWRFGALGNYTHNNVDWKSDFGKGDVDSVQLGVYTEYCSRYVYADGVLAGGINWYDIRRFALIPDQNGLIEKVNISSNFRGYPFVAHLKAGGNGWLTDSVVVSPELTVSYHYLHTNEFKEKGLSVTSWNVDSDSTSMLHTDLGALLSKTFLSQNYRFVLFTGLSWVINWPLGDGDYTASLVDFPSNSSTFSSYNKCCQRVSPKVGLKVSSLKNCTAFELRYRSEIGSGQTYHSATAAVQAQF